MNKETINKAADEFAEREYEISGVDRDYLHKGFYHGARWRINSVWHDAGKELPDIGKHVVNEDWFDFVANDEKDMKRIMKHYSFKRWAYVSDLLPDGKEARP